MNKKFCGCLFALAIFCLSGHETQAASITWNNTATDYNAGGSWTGLAAPGVNDNATFTGSAGAFLPSLTGSITNQGLTFSTTASSGYMLSAGVGSLTLTNVGTSTNSAINALNTSGTNTISAPIILGGAAATTATFTQAAGGTLNLSGNISSTAAIAGLALTGSNGRIFTLSGSNSYSGDTSTGSSAGITLNLNNANALSTGALVLGVNLSIDNTTASAITLANNNINLSGGSLTFVGTRDLSFGSGTATLSGNNRTITTSARILTIGSIDADTTARVLTN